MEGRDPEPQTDPAAARAAALKALDWRVTHSGQVFLPCIPAATDHYVDELAELFGRLGRPLSDQERGQLDGMLRENIENAYASGAGSKLVVVYETSIRRAFEKDLALRVGVRVKEDPYEGWNEGADDPPFGTHPDARLLAALDELAPDGSSLRILDVGAGTGRNSLALGRRGHVVDAVEPVERFASKLRDAASADESAVRVVEANLFDRPAELSEARYALAVVAEVVSHFRGFDELRELMEVMADVLEDGGLALVSMFLADPGYELDDLERQVAELAWASVFTRAELERALSGLPLRVVSEESVVDFERENLPPGAWPPTGWFETWAAGRSFMPVDAGRPPVTMRWLALERAARTA